MLQEDLGWVEGCAEDGGSDRPRENSIWHQTVHTLGQVALRGGGGGGACGRDRGGAQRRRLPFSSLP